MDAIELLISTWNEYPDSMERFAEANGFKMEEPRETYDRSDENLASLRDQGHSHYNIILPSEE